MLKTIKQDLVYLMLPSEHTYCPSWVIFPYSMLLKHLQQDFHNCFDLLFSSVALAGHEALVIKIIVVVKQS